MLSELNFPFEMDTPFPGSGNIRKLSFKRSNIRYLGINAFAAFPNLESLDLKSMALHSVDPHAFMGLKEIKSIDLGSNRLSEKIFQSFIPVKSTLEQLNVQYNSFTYIGTEEVEFLRQLTKLRSIEFESSLLICNCSLYYLKQWLKNSRISYPARSICQDSQSPITLHSPLSTFYKTCPYLNRPLITNFTHISCDSIFLKWNYTPYLENNVSVIYVVNFVDHSGQYGSRSLRTGETEIIVNGLEPATVYELSISVETHHPNYQSTRNTQHFQVRITQNPQTQNLYDCASKPSYFGAPLTWELTCRIIAVLLMVFVALLITLIAIGLSMICKKRSSLTPTQHRPRPAYGHEVRTGNAAALLTYAHMDFEGPKTSCDYLKRQIMGSPSVTVVHPDNVAYGLVIARGKFGTISQAQAVIANIDQYNWEVTAIQFSHRRLFERSGMKLVELANLKHPNVFNIVAIVDTLPNNGPLTLLFDPLVDYLDVKTFLIKAEQGILSFGLNSELETKNLIISQVAAAMKYLTHNQFVHGDLAARNCVFTRDRRVKVFVTGAGADLYPQDYFARAGHRSLPIRWMSPECIQYGTCSSHSDVWSMGVLIWEVFSNGSLPYNCIHDAEIVAAAVINRGSQLKQPRDCPKEVWNIVKECWISEPISRINFEAIESRMLKDIWNLSVEEETDAMCPTIVQQSAIDRLHLSSVFGLTAADPETDDENAPQSATQYSRNFRMPEQTVLSWV